MGDVAAAPAARLRIVIAEDNYLVREGLRQLLESSGQMEVLAAVGDARELLHAVDRLQPDAVLTDIRMPPGHHTDGIDAAHTIRARQRGVGVVVLSQFAAASYALELFRHGATGLAYLLKDRVGDYEQLIHALGEVAAGRSVVDPDVVDHLVTGRARSSASALHRLTPRELDVLRAMAAGRTNAAIATGLHLSSSAVEKHINSIFAKLDLPPEASTHRRVTAVVTYLQAASAGGDQADGPEPSPPAHREQASRAITPDTVTPTSAGSGGRDRPTFGWDSLTPAERDVVKLVAKGLTNPQIGEQLFISPRTVQSHLRQVFSRLGVATRGELAAEAARHGL